jgi:hypothetical protein
MPERKFLPLFKPAHSGKLITIDTEQPFQKSMLCLRQAPETAHGANRFIGGHATISRGRDPTASGGAGAPIAKPVKREEAINIVTEQIGLFEAVLRRYGGSRHDRT